LRHTTSARRAAINASTVFAVVLAILAGLIFAWVFKVAFLDRKPAPRPPEEKKVTMTVAAFNIPDKTLVTPNMVKTIRLTQDEYNERLANSKLDKRTVLTGNQPVGRTTITSVRAEEPMYEGQFEELTYPVPVSSLLAPGKQSVIIEVPAETTMVQRGDYVDVMCSLQNDKPVFGPSGSSATAILAKGRKVIARFHTTATASRPPAGNIWPYTLEVEPWQAAAIELARKIGGQFSLAVSAKENTDSNGTSLSTAAATGADQIYRDAEARYAETNRFTVSDLAALFGVEEPEPENLFRLERFHGNQFAGTLEYKLPGAPQTTTTSDKSKGTKSNAKPTSGTGSPRTSAGTGAKTVASAKAPAGGNFGFHEVGYDPNACKTCGKKK
jgi:Flp pilus assembly protein CpaB